MPKGRHKDAGEPRNCLYCGRLIEHPADKWQKFCCTICKGSFYDNKRVRISKKELSRLIATATAEAITGIKSRKKEPVA